MHAPREAKKTASSGLRRGRRGRPKRGYSMGRNPFLTYSRHYLQEYKAFLEEITLKEQQRKLRYIERVFNDLKTEGRIDTANPKKMTELEVREYMLWMKEKKLHTNT